jgi:hypothetical protein
MRPTVWIGAAMSAEAIDLTASDDETLPSPVEHITGAEHASCLQLS